MTYHHYNPVAKNKFEGVFWRNDGILSLLMDHETDSLSVLLCSLYK